MNTDQIEDEFLVHGNQYLTFELAGEAYAIDILKVQEIRGFEATTRIPRTPDYLLGVINLRGSVVPVVDLRLRFNLPLPAEDSSAVIILVRIQTKGGERTLGLVVDAVSDVHAINPDDVSDTPDLASNQVKAFITGLATVAGRMLILLDITALVSVGVLEETMATIPAGEQAA